MQRRQFIKSTCAACASGILASSLLSSCSPLPLVRSNLHDGKLAVPLEKFTTTNAILVRDEQLPFDIFLRKENNNYTALYLRCTHEDQPLVANEKAIFCSSHGSSFDFEGNVLQDPAIKPLQKFKTEIIDQTIFITIKNN